MMLMLIIFDNGNKDNNNNNKLSNRRHCLCNLNYVQVHNICQFFVYSLDMKIFPSLLSWKTWVIPAALIKLILIDD